jgi:hypothetical protein
MTPLRLTLLWLVAAGALWLHALVGIPGDYLGQGYPLTPGLKVSAFSVAIDAGLATLPLALTSAIARLVRHRWLALPVIALLWLWAATMLINPFTIDFGTTWTGTEVLVELFLHPLHTPLALALVLSVTAWSLVPGKAT